MNQEIINANIEVHTRMADVYNNEPHFRPENQNKVRQVLQKLQSDWGGKKLLDLGCGTGFIIHLAKDLFQEIHGVDITQAMMDKIDITSGNIELHNTPAESLPFADEYFDMATAYSFIHHVEDYSKVLKEAYRVLKPGGILYIDLEPSKLFWNTVKTVADDQINIAEYPIIAREISSVLFTDSKVEQEFGISKDTFNLAEYTKNILGGIDPTEFEKICEEIGFSSCDVSFQWFMGQGNVIHTESMESAHNVENYLNTILPLSKHLFKYLRFIIIK